MMVTSVPLVGLVVFDAILVLAVLVLLRNASVLAARLPLIGLHPAPGLDLGTSAPLFSLSAVAGGRISLGEYNNVGILLLFVGHTCGVCVPLVHQLAQTVKRFPADRFRVIVVHSGPASRDWVNLRSHLPVGLDEDGQVRDQFGVVQYPTVFVVNGRDRFQVMLRGAVANGRELEAALEAAAMV